MSSKRGEKQSVLAFVQTLRRKYEHAFDQQYQNAGGTSRALLGEIRDSLNRLLDRTLVIASAGTINPWLPLRTHKFVQQQAIRELSHGTTSRRVGVFPLTANPLHWGHVLTALACLSGLDLDCVVFLVQRRITYKALPHREQLSVRHRYQMVEHGISDFFPLLRNTDVATRNSKIGETAIQDLARLNRDTGTSVEFIGLWGTETKQRVETIMRQLAESFGVGLENADRLGISLAFFGRHRQTTAVTESTIKRIAKKIGFSVPWRLLHDDDVPAQISSTGYRRTRNPVLVPPGVHEYVISNRLYGS